MEQCNICEKEFKTYRGLNGHMRMHGKSGGTYSVPRPRKNPQTFNCLNCDKENVWSGSSTNKYCDFACQHEYTYRNVHIPLILEGKKGFDSRPLKRFIMERDGSKCTECGVGETWNSKPLTLQLDHIDGNSDNNMPDNLRILCPNCHTQTDNHGSKGNGNRYKKKTKRNKYLRKYKSGL